MKQFFRRLLYRLKHALRLCAEDGCWHKGDDCFLPDNADGKPDEYVCAEHAHKFGYCYACGSFGGGIESFEFRRSGLCDNCESEVRSEFDEDGDPDFDDHTYP